eukprot:1419460-Lingulodinium_polyedra.AAC.1
MKTTWQSRQPNVPAAQMAPQLGQPSTLPVQPNSTALIENSATSSFDLSSENSLVGTNSSTGP